MYLNFYQLKRAPFNVTPDPEFLFWNPSYEEILGTLMYGIQERKGLVVILGEVGLGKTTLLRSALERFDPQRLKVIHTFHANGSFKELLEILYR